MKIYIYKSRARSESGMTFVEVLAVVIILGLIATTLLIGFSGSFGTAKRELAKAGMGQILQKLEVYKMTTSQWPTSDAGLNSLTKPLAKPTDAYYVEPSVLFDPWKKPYYFVAPGPDGHPYEIVTYGADGKPGGEGEDSDLSSVDLGAVAAK